MPGQTAILLTPAVKNYPWGRVGTDSLVARLGCSVDAVFSDTPYAELWMGAHPSGSSTLGTGQTLLEYINYHSDALGEEVVRKFGGKLPFLFKVLSVRSALSIQAHPDKALAEILHRKDPSNYPDDNHKPEMAIAVTPFEVLCGFRSLEKISGFIKDIPELRSIVTDAPLRSEHDLRRAFAQLMKCAPEIVQEQIERLLSRGKDVPEHELVHRLSDQFPGDVGILCVFFLQHFVLQPGEALFLPANEPHAYLSGDCLECMANSDNVVRAGLTPKFKDVDVLTQMLTFESGKDWVVHSVQLEPGTLLYKAPVNEFAVEAYDKRENFNLKQNGSCSVCIVLDGEGDLDGIKLSKGKVIFIPSGPADIVVAVEKRMKLYRAFSPV